MSFGSFFSFVLVIFVFGQNAECNEQQYDEFCILKTNGGVSNKKLSENEVPAPKYTERISKNDQVRTNEVKRDRGDVGETQKFMEREYRWQRRYPAIVLAPRVPDSYDSNNN